ncbi:MAG: hypothetical protein ACI9SB_000542 [Candidatus Azotimanducaceae bacterium]|jgi:hypothetical protein
MRYSLTRFTATTVNSSLSCEETCEETSEVACEVTCEVTRLAGQLNLHYVLTGDLAQIDWPTDNATPARRMQLWEQTCFEAFLRQPDEHAYIETNASPSGHWQCFTFSNYRTDMLVATTPTLQVLDSAVSQTRAEIRVQVNLADWLAPTEMLLMGLAAVVQTKAGDRLYYALQHIDDKPDFHHRDSHTLLIP